jgi:hypothetical protein
LILRRQGDLWKVSEQNDRALMRDVRTPLSKITSTGEIEQRFRLN